MGERVLVPYRFDHKAAAYTRAAREVGLEAVPISVSEHLVVKGYAGVLLTGGTDVNPACYGEQAQPETEKPDDERDRAELKVIEEAIQMELPILAICRGLQILNVYHGGTLIQDLADARTHDPETDNVAQVAHEVAIEPDSLLASVAGTATWQVNSRHHQAADRIGSRMQVCARATDDKTVEGLERPDRKFVLGVQWHPEDQIFRHPEQLKLFRRFREACG